jgi:hypothetical protein
LLFTSSTLAEQVQKAEPIVTDVAEKSKTVLQQEVKSIRINVIENSKIVPPQDIESTASVDNTVLEPTAPYFLEQLENLAEFEASNKGARNTLQGSIDKYYADELTQDKYPTLLHDAAITGLLNLLSYLIKNGPHKVNYAYIDGPTALGYISGDNQLKAAKTLLLAGADANHVGNMAGQFPLSAAIISGNIQMVKLLLSHGAKVHIGLAYQSPLNLILERNDLEMLQMLDEHEFTFDPFNEELRKLVLSYLNSDFVEEAVLRILIKHGFDIYSKNAEHSSFVEQYAKQINHSDVKQMLSELYLESQAQSESELYNTVQK